MQYVSPEEARNIHSLQQGCFRISAVLALLIALLTAFRTRSLAMALVAGLLTLALSAWGGNIGKRMAIGSLGNHLDIKQGIWVGYLIGALASLGIVTKLVEMLD